jgi:predicted metalloprotease with PDZ domain
MKKPLLLAALFLCILNPTLFADNNTYDFTIDLTSAQNHEAKVELICPPLSESAISYSLPKIVPGTYAIYDYGRFIDDFHAYDASGAELTVAHTDTNTWNISGASRLHRITYEVTDTYHPKEKFNPIFEPAGSNIQGDTNFVVNTFAFLGYFRNHEMQPYEIDILHRPDFYGSTALTDLDSSSSRDRFEESNYHVVADNPIMYDVPDTATVQVGNCKVLISVYSPNKLIHASYLAAKLDTLLQAQGKYLGGTLPVNKYAFIIYTHNKPGVSGGDGALEHSYCSMYYLPEIPQEQLATFFRDAAAHEFFHILTPLTIHSEEIQYFNFDEPKMSEHLWLYEGTTEYHAHLVQVRYQIISPDDFLKRMAQKMTVSMNNFNDTVPFIVMSKECLDKYKDQYVNVYQKGALIGMCLDIELRSLSNGKHGLIDLIQDLGKIYGKDSAFKDDELFDKIGQITYPQITTFLKTYVGGNKPLPFGQVFDLVGVTYTAPTVAKQFTFGRFSAGVDPSNNRIKVTDVSNMNDFGKKMGYREGDELVSVNGQNVDLSNFSTIRQNWLDHAKEGDKMKVVVMRKQQNGSFKKVTLKARVFKANTPQTLQLTFNDQATQQQLFIRHAWLNP